MPSISVAQSFSTNARRAVVLEAFYALRQVHDGGCNAYINGNCVSTWNFLNDQTYPGPYAYSALKSFYSSYNDGTGCYASDWAVPGEYCYFAAATSPSFYSNLSSYGLSTAGGVHGNVGRGGQCKFFANLILYRSEVDTSMFPLTQNMWSSNTDANLQHAVEGDVIMLHGDTGSFSTDHFAVVVQIYRSGSTITALDVIDSNYISDTANGTSNREVIARHAFCTVSSGCPFSNVQMIQGHYRLYEGTSYFSNKNYNPNI